MNIKAINLRSLVAGMLCFGVIFMLGACAPGLNTSMSVDFIDDSELTTRQNDPDQQQVRATVLRFDDARVVEAIAQIDGRLVKPDGDIGTVVQRIFESQLKADGISLSLFDAPAIRGKVVEWRVNVVPGFPSTTIQATAAIDVEIIDNGKNIVHRARYSGNFERTHPFLDEGDIRKALGKAMSFAAHEAVQDPAFSQTLLSYQAQRR